MIREPATLVVMRRTLGAQEAPGTIVRSARVRSAAVQYEPARRGGPQDARRAADLIRDAIDGLEARIIITRRTRSLQRDMTHHGRFSTIHDSFARDNRHPEHRLRRSEAEAHLGMAEAPVVYGALRMLSPDQARGVAPVLPTAHYGTTASVLGAHMLDRSTFTVGDSLDRFLRNPASINGSDLAASGHISQLLADTPLAASAVRRSRLGRTDRQVERLRHHLTEPMMPGRRYIEAQVDGPVTPRDIDALTGVVYRVPRRRHEHDVADMRTLGQQMGLDDARTAATRL